VVALRAGRVVGQGHRVHHDQHAAGEDADDRADQDVRQRADADPEKRPTCASRAIIERPSRIATRLGIFASVINALAPKAYEVVMNTAFELFPDSAAAKGDARRSRARSEPSGEQIAFAALMRGVHW
jgi:hypothetical protein